ncbi:hypothetical protein FHS27_004780 [Rhodopirellula rubra]|uniref:Uncharacterized protein n=1 Tax=Aporhodopirellula rubra TaxID=980271 RepID=A0A7W5E2C6_9BACT|nr:hypothetical protein [Aporhodopirellula rubra]
MPSLTTLVDGHQKSKQGSGVTTPLFYTSPTLSRLHAQPQAKQPWTNSLIPVQIGGQRLSFNSVTALPFLLVFQSRIEFGRGGGSVMSRPRLVEVGAQNLSVNNRNSSPNLLGSLSSQNGFREDAQSPLNIFQILFESV